LVISIITFTFESQTLKQIKMRKTIKLSDLDLSKVSNLNKYQEETIAQALRQAAEVSEFYPCIAMAEVQPNEEDGTFYFEHTELKLDTPNFDLFIRFDGRAKQWQIFERSTQRLKFMPYDNLNRVKEKMQMPRPNGIGVLSTKKIEQWIAYRTTFIMLALYEQKQIIEKADAFMKKVSQWPHAWKSENNLKGQLETPKHRYTYQISDTGHIYETIEYKGPNTLEAFANLT